MSGIEIAIIGAMVGQSLFQMKAQDAQEAGQIQQLQAQRQADEYNAELARQNAKIVEGQTQAQIEQADRERRIRLGKNIAAGSASGGSDIGDILFDNAAQEELSILTIAQEGILKKRGFTSQADLLDASAKNTVGQISAVKQAGSASKVASVLGNVSKGLGMYNSFGGAENMAGQSSGFNPAKSAPLRKPTTVGAF